MIFIWLILKFIKFGGIELIKMLFKPTNWFFLIQWNFYFLLILRTIVECYLNHRRIYISLSISTKVNFKSSVYKKFKNKIIFQMHLNM